MSSPILTKTFVTDLDMSAADAYVADPFITKDGATWYLWFEAYRGLANGGAILAYGTSPDLVNWTYGSKLTVDGVDWETSYPFVFQCDGLWWLVHNDIGGTIKLYRPKTWPNDWTLMQTIVTQVGITFRDTSIFQFGGTWYIIAYDAGNINCRLFYNATLYGSTWSEHPSSPILTGDDHARPGGRPISRPGVGVDIFIQDSIPDYGNQLRIYRLTDLTTTTVTVTELETSPIIAASGSGWNAAGMHQLDRVNPTYSIVDGNTGGAGGGVYSIGLYEDA